MTALNWRQELAKELAGIPDLNRNTAVLIYNINSYDPFTGLGGDFIPIRRPLVCKAPEQVDARLVDGKNYLAGDLVAEITYVDLIASRDPLPGDPAISNNGMDKTLADMRPYDATTGGIDIGIDELQFGDISYTIVNVRAAQWLDDLPAIYVLTLRK